MAKPKILIADDEKPTRDAMARILSSSCECLTAPDAELAMKLVEENPDLALLLTDYKMPGENGVSLIKRAKAVNPSLACILITAFGEIELAVEAMKEGADDFITKPITDIAQMELRVKKALEKHALSRKVAELQQKVDEQSGIESFTGKSPAMEKSKALREPARSLSQRRFTTCRRERQAHSSPSSARRFRLRSSSPSSSATRKARSRAQTERKSESSRQPAAERSSSTR